MKATSGVGSSHALPSRARRSRRHLAGIAVVVASGMWLLGGCVTGSTQNRESAEGAAETPAAATAPQASAPSMGLGPEPTFTRLPPKLSTGSADVQNGRLVWISGPKSYGLDHYAIWTMSENGNRRRIRRLPKGHQATGIGIDFPSVVWVEYREVGNTTGPWKIMRHDLRDRRNTVIAEWDGRGPEAEEAIPLPSVDEGIVAWHQLIRDGNHGRRFCIEIRDLDEGAHRSEGCTDDLARFPHWARVNDGRVAYVINTEIGDEGSCGISYPPPRFSEPRSPDYPQLERLFAADGPLSEWDLSTRIAEADDEGVAWITEGACYGQPGGIFYWEPGREPSRRPEIDPEFPPLEVFLMNDAIVWNEPDVADDVFAVRRELLSCASAAVAIAKRWFKERYGRLGGHAIDLLGASDSEVLVSLQRSGGSNSGVGRQTLGIFSIPPLPTECRPGP